MEAWTESPFSSIWPMTQRECPSRPVEDHEIDLLNIADNISHLALDQYRAYHYPSFGFDNGRILCLSA
jgi:hypothetical protein